jgi:predicted esterase
VSPGARGAALVASWLFSACTPSPTRAPDLRAATCLGPADATGLAVYLHGVDEPGISDQELENRRHLEAIAHTLSLRIAVPRASTRCPDEPNQLCWGWTFDDAELDSGAKAISAAAAACFGAERRFGLIGFSNGGYLVTKLLRTCSVPARLPSVTWMLTIGSAMSRGPLEPAPPDLSGCGRLVMIEGTHDTWNFDPEDHLLHGLEGKHADVRAIRFDGGHGVPVEPTRAALADLVRPP